MGVFVHHVLHILRRNEVGQKNDVGPPLCQLTDRFAAVLGIRANPFLQQEFIAQGIAGCLHSPVLRHVPAGIRFLPHQDQPNVPGFLPRRRAEVKHGDDNGCQENHGDTSIQEVKPSGKLVATGNFHLRPSSFASPLNSSIFAVMTKGA